MLPPFQNISPSFCTHHSHSHMRIWRTRSTFPFGSTLPSPSATYSARYFLYVGAVGAANSSLRIDLNDTPFKSNTCLHSVKTCRKVENDEAKSGNDEAKGGSVRHG